MDPWPKGHPRYVESLDEQIASLTTASVDEVKKFYADFYGAAAGELAVVGDFDPAEVTRIATDVFAAGRTRNRSSAFLLCTATSAGEPDSGDARQGQRVLHRRPESQPAGRRPDYPGLVLGNYMLAVGS